MFKDQQQKVPILRKGYGAHVGDLWYLVPTGDENEVEGLGLLRHGILDDMQPGPEAECCLERFSGP